MSAKRYRLFAGLLLLTPILYGQFDPEGAQVISYFPQLADGGPPNQQRITSLTFVNSHQSDPAAGTVHIYGNNGGPLALDFGGGAVSSFSFTVPPQGTVAFKTTGASPATLTGWAIVSSSLPLEGVV